MEFLDGRGIRARAEPDKRSPESCLSNDGIINHNNCVAKMASHAIFQYNVLVIDDTYSTITNMIVKMTILRLLCSSGDKEKIGVARPEGPPLRWFRYHRLNR